MKKLMLLCSFILLNSIVYSQISFEEGYFIDTLGQKIDCLIKNNEWKNNPRQFKYKTSEDAATQTKKIEAVTEFGVAHFKYIRFSGKMDISSMDERHLGYSSEPKFRDTIIFLRYLIEGEANLLSFVGVKFRRYFYFLNNDEPVQLIYKQYQNDNYKIRENSRYIEQLWTNLKCETLTINELQKVEYNKKDMIQYFTKYNKCKEAEFINYTVKDRRPKLHLNLRPAVNYSSLSVIEFSIFNLGEVDRFDVSNELGFRFGAEFELVLPYNKGKWSIIAEPTLQYFHSDVDVDIPFPALSHLNIDYNSLEIPIGIRYHIFFNQSSKLFINVSSVVDIDLNTNILKDRNHNLKPILINKSIAAGIGMNLKNKYSLELRLLSRRIYFEADTNYGFLTNYKTYSLILGYRLF